jgi:hypothetical protein
MAASWLRDDRCETFPEDDYRAYLISRNPPPIVHHSCGVRLRRLQVRLDHTVTAIDHMLHRVIEALARSKTRRIQRELQLRGIRYAQRTDDDPSLPR